MKPISPSGTLAIACGIFLALGIFIAGIGPALPDLAENAANSLAALGGVFTAVFSGVVVSQFVVGPLSDRMGQRRLLLGGMILISGGIFGLTLSRSLPIILVCAAGAGIGQGGLSLLLNVLIARLFPARSTSALNLLNVFFGIGAVIGPAMAGLTARHWGTALPGLWLSGGLVLAQLGLVPFLAIANPDAKPADSSASQGRIFKIPTLWLLGGFLFIYIGTETAIAGWAPTYLIRSTELELTVAAQVTAGFWLALTCGRIIGAIIGTRLTSIRVLQICLIGAVVGGLGFAFSTGNVLLSSVAILLLGLCFGPVFPTSIALVTATFPHAQGTASSLVIGIGNGGGIVLPLLLGFLLERHSPQSSALLVLACTVAMGAAFMLYRLLSVRQPAIPLNLPLATCPTRDA